MKKGLFLILLLLVVSSASASDIASINMKNIENAMQDYVMSMEKYAELKKQMAEADDNAEQVMEKMKTEEGKISFDFKDTAKSIKKYKMKKQLQDIIKRELVILLSEMNLKYKFIFNSSEQDAILYSDTQIIDLTQNIYQEIVKRLKTD